MGVWDSGIWTWHLKWRRPFFSWEEDLYRDFILLLDVAPISLEKPSWSFRHDKDGLFSVKATYVFLSSKLALPPPLPPSHCGILYKVWDSWAPSKVVVFSWQALLSRIPTRANLARRGVVSEGDLLVCAVCGGGVETENHLFLLCPLAWSIWVMVYR
ncbi:putative ribonuclease H protein, partial [Trifolium medium]|nr:putative ribonuclease H protein [Trifolium medium]